MTVTCAMAVAQGGTVRHISGTLRYGRVIMLGDTQGVEEIVQ